MPVRIVIADDHALVRGGLRRLLSLHDDLEVVGEADNAAAAVAMVVETAADVLVTDLKMPGGGLQAIQSVRTQSPSTRVLVVTMREDARALRAAFAAGALGFVPKSAGEAEIVSAVRAVAAGRPSIDGRAEHGLRAVERRGSGRQAALLSRREVKVLELLAEGRTSSEIARRLRIGESSVETYRGRLREKLGARTWKEFYQAALKAGIVPALLCGLLSACLTQGNGGVAPPPVNGATVAPQPVAPGPRGAVMALLESQYQALRAGDADAFGAVWADDAFVFGPRADDRHLERTAATAAFRRRFTEGGVPGQVTSLALRVRVPDGAHCAWSFDQVRITHGNLATRYHVASLVDERDGRYEVIAQAWTMPLPNIVAFARAGQGGLPEPSPIAEDVGPGAEPLRDAVRRWQRQRYIGPFEDRVDTILVGTAAEDIIEGDVAIQEEVSGLLEDPDVRIRNVSGVHARVACDGRLAFVAFNQTFVLGQAELALPARALAFYEEEGDGYRPVLLFNAFGEDL